MVQNFKYHADRAFQTSGICLPFPQVPEDKQLGVLKCRIVYDTEVSLIEFMPYMVPHIQSLKVVEASSYFYDKKCTDRSCINQLYQQMGQCDDILIAINGLIADTSFCNVVFENENGLYTPAHPLLKGTKRALLIDQTIITPCHITLDDLKHYSHVRLINAMIDLDNPTTRFNTSQIFR